MIVPYTSCLARNEVIPDTASSSQQSGRVKFLKNLGPKPTFYAREFRNGFFLVYHGLLMFSGQSIVKTANIEGRLYCTKLYSDKLTFG